MLQHMRRQSGPLAMLPLLKTLTRGHLVRLQAVAEDSLHVWRDLALGQVSVQAISHLRGRGLDRFSEGRAVHQQALLNGCSA